MYATPVSLVALPPPREVGLSEWQDRSTAPPSMLPQGSAFHLQRTSCGAGRLARRGGAVARMTGPFAPPIKRSYAQLAPRSHRWLSCSRTALTDVYKHDKYLHMALSAAECAGLQARGTSRLSPARPCRCMSCPRRRAHAVTASDIQVRAGYCKDFAENLSHAIESENIRQKDRTLLTKLRARLSYIDAGQPHWILAVRWPADATTLTAASCPACGGSDRAPSRMLLQTAARTRASTARVVRVRLSA